MESLEIRERIEKNLKNTLDDIGKMYLIMKRELKHEILNKEKKNIEVSEKIKEIYKQLDYEKCNKLIKSKLPIRIKLFNKVKCIGYSIHRQGSIEVRFVFNDNLDNIFSYVFSISDFDINS